MSEEELRRRLETLEREHQDQIARANAALAAAQDRSYWLDRWGVDLNAVMRRRGVVAAVQLAELPDRVAKARRKAAREVERG